MEPLILVVVLAAVLALVWYFTRTPRPETPASAPGSLPGAEHPEPAMPPDPARLHELAAQATAPFTAAASPGDLDALEPFRDGVRHLLGNAYSDADLIAYFTGDNAVIACMALSALARREGDADVVAPILAGFNDVAPWTRHFALRVLEARVPPGESLLPKVLTRIDPSWMNRHCVRILREFVKRRVDGGEKATFGDALATLATAEATPAGIGLDDEDEPVATPAWLSSYLPRLGKPVRPMIDELRKWNEGRIDETALRAIGAVWGPNDPADKPVPHPSLEQRAGEIETELLRTPAHSVLLVGESGTGKTAAIHLAGERLKGAGWTVFEAGHSELMAGMTYIGQLEDRMRQLVGLLGGGRRVLWIVPQFHSLTWAGTHQYERSSVLDFLLPRIESGDLRILGETTPAGYQRILRSKPRCRTAMRALTIEPLTSEETLRLARDWVRARTPAGAPAIMTEATLQEAWNLAQQFMGTRAAPGNLLELLAITLRKMQGGDPAGRVEVRTDDLIATLGSLTGLPASILDDRARLNLSELRTRFESRILGQPEAVDCLVERVAMIKAGVTDPTRPQGVFLMAGPTGTGKTEIAKVLAEYLFGSPDRMVRLDMSELQDEAWSSRIFGDPGAREDGDALIDRVRKQPFCVILLDEFEKAHRRVWDVFLQVFDDGRLTDRLGRTADFRHALILMTSNLGASIPSGLGLGFLDRTGAFSADSVLRAVENVFRKEFLNRIDRVIVFRPLKRETMRAILRKELNEVYRRRGLRNRPWAVEWDEAALEFLLEKGFTADLGARPLKRSIERHLLAPLARAIVDHRFPEGDQFLFVTSDGSKLQVRFVDPEAPEGEGAAADAAGTAPEPETIGVEGGGEDADLPRVVLSPRGTQAEVALLRANHDRLAKTVEEEGFRNAKASALDAMSAPGFWESPERFAVLGRAEYIDRIESSLATGGSLLERLEGMASRTLHLPRDLVGRVAQQLWLLGHAVEDVARDRPTEAWLLVDAGYETGASAMRSDEFARKLTAMYRGWARRRGMRSEVLEEVERRDQPYRMILAVSGYAAWALLEGEDGMHVWEVPADAKKAPVRRCAVRVRVAPQPEAPVDDPLAHAHRELGRPDGAAPDIVRRYRETPSPLVRDVRRGWRTGHLDRVLAGDFDLL